MRFLIEPDWVCFGCAKERGARVPDGHRYTVHTDTCGICNQQREVTEPRDFGGTRHLLRIEKKKICIECNKEKPLSEFPKQYYVRKKSHRCKGDGHRTDCKTCHNKHNVRNWKKKPLAWRRRYMREYMRNYNKLK